MAALPYVVAAAWGGTIALLFVSLVRTETLRVMPIQRHPHRIIRSRARLVRWVVVSAALFAPALWGTPVIAALVGFDLVRRLAIRAEAMRGD